jgi:hypothetical protein
MSSGINTSHTTLLTFVIRETPSNSTINVISNNPRFNIILVSISETKFKIKDPNLFYRDRNKYKSYDY